MNAKTQPPGGSNPSDPVDPGTIQQTIDPANVKPDTVLHSTHDKLLKEKKRRDQENVELRGRLEEFEKEKKEKEESELKQQNEYQKLLGIRDQELEQERKKNQDHTQTLQNGQKLRAFLDSVGGKVEEHYWDLIRLEDIAMNPETGTPDPASVEQFANDFKQKYWKIIDSGKGPKVTNDAPGTPGGAMTVQEWKALQTGKEMRENYHKVFPQKK